MEGEPWNAGRNVVHNGGLTLVKREWRMVVTFWTSCKFRNFGRSLLVFGPQSVISGSCIFYKQGCLPIPATLSHQLELAHGRHQLCSMWQWAYANSAGNQLQPFLHHIPSVGHLQGTFSWLPLVGLVLKIIFQFCSHM